MPQVLACDIQVAKDFARFNKLTVPVEDVEKAVANGAKLEVEESLFGDPGDDYNKLLLDGVQVGFWEGY